MLQDIPIQLNEPAVLRRVGIGRDERPIAPDIQTAYARALDVFERNRHIRAMAVYGMYALQSISRDHITLENGFKIVGSFVHEQAPTATAVAMVICTLGPEIERISRNYLAGHDMLMRVMLDGVATAAVDQVETVVARMIRAKVRASGLAAGRPINPGMPGLPLKTQVSVFQILPAHKIGVSLTSGNVMKPLKSLSFMMAIGLRMAQWSEAPACGRCHLFSVCRYRKT